MVSGTLSGKGTPDFPKIVLSEPVVSTISEASALYNDCIP